MTLPQLVSHKSLALETPSTQSSTKENKGGFLITVTLIMYIHAYTRKLKPTGPFHYKSTQTLGILLMKVMFLPQNDPNLTQIGAKLKENVPGRRGGTSR